MAQGGRTFKKILVDRRKRVCFYFTGFSINNGYSGNCDWIGLGSAGTMGTVEIEKEIAEIAE